MSRNIRLYLEDIVMGCARILRYTQDMRFGEFLAGDAIEIPDPENNAAVNVGRGDRLAVRAEADLAS